MDRNIKEKIDNSHPYVFSGPVGPPLSQRQSYTTCLLNEVKVVSTPQCPFEDQLTKTPTMGIFVDPSAY